MDYLQKQLSRVERVRYTSNISKLLQTSPFYTRYRLMIFQLLAYLFFLNQILLKFLHKMEKFVDLMQIPNIKVFILYFCSFLPTIKLKKFQTLFLYNFTVSFHILYVFSVYYFKKVKLNQSNMFFLAGFYNSLFLLYSFQSKYCILI